MCGIAGFLGQAQPDSVLRDMVAAITARGPDGEGFYVDTPVHMGMRRLSIIDVTGGDQPIYTSDRAIAIVFNGEIYNYRDLRKNLQDQGYVFQTQSDTEVVLALYQLHGADCVSYLRGMFAFAIHDKKQNRVFMARDRLGIKPFYYYQTPAGTFVFGSEVKSLFCHPDVSRHPDFKGIDAYLSLRYSPGPDSMFEGVKKLPAGHTMTWCNGGIDIQQYWQWDDYKVASQSHRTDADIQTEFNELFEESVRLRMISDVPLGAFLSGGVDSTAIVAAMSKYSDKPVEAFSVGFDWEGDELPEARVVAQRLGCHHHEVICKPEDMQSLPKLIHALDEPVGDPIILPMYLVSKLARQHVTVSLSGEGADEMLGGYFMHKTLLRGRSVPKALLPMLTAGVHMTPVQILDRLFDYPGKMGARSKRKLVDFLSVLQKGTISQQYHFLISLFDKRDKQSLYAPEFQESIDTFLQALPDAGDWPTELAQILSLQERHWMSDDILTKLDKMTMVNSLEGRVPFLDHKLVEFLLSVPDHMKRAGGQNKVLLRNYLDTVLPGGVAKRPKKAFYVPLEKYLVSGPLQEMAEQCLSPESIKKRGYFDPQAVEGIKKRLESGDFVYAKQYFSLLSLELWFRIFIDGEKGWT